MNSKSSITHSKLTTGGSSLVECLVATLILCLCALSLGSLIESALKHNAYADFYFAAASHAASQDLSYPLPERFTQSNRDHCASDTYQCFVIEEQQPMNGWQFSWPKATR